MAFGLQKSSATGILIIFMLVICVLCADIVVQFIYATEALFHWRGKVYIAHMVPSLKAFSDIE